MIQLPTQARESGEKAEGQIAAVAYGPKFLSQSISVPYAEFVKAYNQVGETGLISLSIEGKNVNVLVHEITLHPVKNSVEHVDFYVPEAGKKIHANIPLAFVGESAAVKAGNILIKVMHEVEVEALPENLPHDIQVDISKLATLEDDIKVSDLVFPAGVSVKSEAEEVVASVVAPQEEKEESAPVDLSAIEVEQKGKKEETEE
jgi:large subunit ribosomal protein L25